MLARSMKRGLTALMTIVAVALVAPENGLQAAPLGVIDGEVLDVQAERLEVNVDKATAELHGNVRVMFGQLEVKCPKVDIRYDESPRVRWAKGSGGVIARLQGIDAQAQTIELDVPKRRVELKGGVRLARGRGWVTAERASIDLATQHVSLHDVKGSIPVEAPAR